jgi:hypothetical protein
MASNTYTSVCDWDDDERSLSLKYINTAMRNNKKDDTKYVPITQIMKEYYDEEKAKLYCYSPPESPLHTYSNLVYTESSSFASSSNDDQVEDESSYEISSGTSSDTGNTEENDTEDPLVKIMEDAVYKKFSYV